MQKIINLLASGFYISYLPALVIPFKKNTGAGFLGTLLAVPFVFIRKDLTNLYNTVLPIRTDILQAPTITEATAESIPVLPIWSSLTELSLPGNSLTRHLWKSCLKTRTATAAV